MTGLTHRVLGAEVGLGVASVGVAAHHLALTGVPIVIGAMALGMLAAQVPDWDLRLHIPHRGPTHSIIVVAILTALATFASHALLPAMAILVLPVVGLALVSHLLADLTNKTPMALLWPVMRRRMRPDWLPYALEDSWKGHIVEAVTILGVGAAVVPGLMAWV